MIEKIKKIGTIVFICVISITALNYINAASRPANISIDGPSVINESTTDQTKGTVSGGNLSLVALGVGDYVSNLSSNTSYTTVVDSDGYMSVGRTTTGSSALDVFGSGYNLGTIRATSLAHSGSSSREICAGIDGVLSLCPKTNTYFVKNNESTVYTFIVPNGVSALDFKIYAGGGAGYANFNLVYQEDDGDSSYLRYKDASIVANGGKGANYIQTGGAGGSYSSSLGSVSGAISTTASGGNGEVVSGLNEATNIAGPGNCSGNTAYAVKGGSGKIGGKGGASYGFSQAEGGEGGVSPIAGTYNGSDWFVKNQDGSVNCYFYGLSNYYSTSLSGKNGVNGTYGSGGSGYGSNAGFSGVINNNTSDCSIFGTIYSCRGKVSASGGGAGGYISGSLYSVTPGEVITIKVGKGGVVKGVDENVHSGNGGDGMVEITYK